MLSTPAVFIFNMDTVTVTKFQNLAQLKSLPTWSGENYGTSNLDTNLSIINLIICFILEEKGYSLLQWVINTKHLN